MAIKRLSGLFFGDFMPKKATVLVALVLMLSLAFAQPEPPTGLDAEFDETGVRITWKHPGGVGVSYNLYRGQTLNDAKLLANVSGKSYLDQDVEPGVEYVYFVTAVNEDGESYAVQTLSVTPVGAEEKPFKISAVSPSEAAYNDGEEVEFVIGIESDYFGELEDLRAVLINEQFGISKSMEFDPFDRVFRLDVQLPTSSQPEGIVTTYTVWVSARYRGNLYSEQVTYQVGVVPQPPHPLPTAQDAFQPLFQFIREYWLLLLLLPFVIIGAVFAKNYLKKKRVAEDRLLVNFINVLKERSIYKNDLLKKKIDSKQYAEKERALQQEQGELEKKIKIWEKGIEVSANPFAGFSREEMEQVGELAKTVVDEKRAMSKQEMVDWLLGQGTKEKIAKKVVDLLYGSQD